MALTPKTTLIPFHGLLHNVIELNNNPKQIIDKARLAWNAVKTPLYALDTKGNQIEYGYYAVANDVSGKYIDGGRPVTNNFELLDNQTIIEDMVEFSKEHSMLIDYVGALDNGRLIVAHAKFATADILAGDYIESGIMMVASHQWGVASRWLPHANRLVCSNGMVVGENLSHLAFRLPHRGEKYDKAMVKLALQDALFKGFPGFLNALRDINRTVTTAEVNKIYLAQLIQPQLLQVISERARLNSESPKFIVQSAITKSFMPDVINATIMEKGSRTLAAVIDILDTQPGAGFTNGTLAQPFQALTYWVNHMRGWETRKDSAVEENLLGKGAMLMRSGFNMARVYKEWITEEVCK